MIKSMTGYAACEKTANEITTVVEIRSYNSRYLDPVVRLAHQYAVLEEPVRKQLARRLARGRVEVRIQVQDRRETANAFEVDLTRARSYLWAADTIKKALRMESDITLDHLASVNGVIQPVDRPQELEALWTAVGPCLEEAIDQLEQMREKEGRFLAKDLAQHLEKLAALLKQIEEQAGNLPALYRRRLEERIDALCAGQVELDRDRIAQEAAILADRSDISEELVRAASHLEQFGHIMDGDEPAGRKLNFLLQEINREFNTMGSKLGKAEVAHLVVEAKAEIEKLREQVQNIE